VYGVTNDNIYKRFTSRSTVVHSLFEFCLSPLLVFPAFLIYLRKVLRARRSKAARQHLQHMRDPKLHHGSFRTCRVSCRVTVCAVVCVVSCRVSHRTHAHT
jgi:hypothetical protein